MCTLGTSVWRAMRSPQGRRTGPGALILAVVLVVGGCDSESPTSPTAEPTPTPLPGVSLGPASGPTTIRLLSATPSPGTTITGCGVTSTGCAGRVRMTFAIANPTGGQASSVHASLHSATTHVACLTGTIPGVQIPAGESEIDILFDGGEGCPTPLTLSNLAVTVSASTSLVGRQEWGLTYALRR